jgi:hypothetical protein
LSSSATIIYATGVVDFTADDDDIRAMLTEGRRVVKASGNIFVAFYKASEVQKGFLELVRLIRDHRLAFRASLEVDLLNPLQLVVWVASRAGLGRFRATMALLRAAVSSTALERRNTLKMQRGFRRLGDPRSLIEAAVPYRNQKTIENLFQRLSIPNQQLSEFGSCGDVRIQVPV